MTWRVRLPWEDRQAVTWPKSRRIVSLPEPFPLQQADETLCARRLPSRAG
jgi:hypothetical protein